MAWKRLLAALRFGALALVFIVLAAPEWPDFKDDRYQIDAIIGQRSFDFVVWEINALLTKGQAFLVDGQDYITDEERQSLVLEYLALVGEVRGQERQLETIYSDPDIPDPDSESNELRQQIATNRAKLEKIQPIAESIIQEQVAAVLVDEGFDLLGSAWPPVQMHITPLPSILVVSPRDEIRQLYNISLDHGLSVDSQEEIETSVLANVDHSALVVPIAGIGIYPAMIVERSNINRLSNTVAHEWAHHWLSLHPLGLSYALNDDLRTINETVSSIVGDEIGAKVIERFYPLHVPVESSPPDNDSLEPADPDRFDINREMAQTRIQVDELLAEGSISEAEDYMEERRQYFWENGYRFRKLNQAFFAFYGAYADTPGEQGDDPTGPAILAIREDSTNLREFLDRMASITSIEGLQQEAALVSGLGD